MGVGVSVGVGAAGLPQRFGAAAGAGAGEATTRCGEGAGAVVGWEADGSVALGCIGRMAPLGDAGAG
ncbi:MAG: hypothetical protein Q8R28_12155 [Dehalococcoidia bacterium]|nr:hypothetical protein [Dehalococcoidia bacterium]